MLGNESGKYLHKTELKDKLGGFEIVQARKNSTGKKKARQGREDGVENCV